jgi:cellulose synthase/poly-beta-1,6-N-acetylglucosamine synthase-like glycosyltransferase
MNNKIIVPVIPNISVGHNTATNQQVLAMYIVFNLIIILLYTIRYIDWHLNEKHQKYPTSLKSYLFIMELNIPFIVINGLAVISLLCVFVESLL